MATFKTGKVGERFVELWASQAGVVANRVSEDEYGWDICLQFEAGSPAASDMPLDLHPPGVTSFVQVKTTAVDARSESVTLSNWQRMVKDPHPWFFVRVVLDADGEVERAYVVHVDEGWMSKVLKRLRGLSEEDAAEPHRHTLDLTWSESDAIGVPYGKSLRQRILDTVGDLSTYVREKVERFRTLGYDESRFRVSVTTTFATPEDIERHVDFAIGLEKRLPIRDMSVSDVRFDIARPLKERTNGEGYMEFAAAIPSLTTTSLSFANKDKSRRVRLQCQTFVPTILLRDVPPEYFKVRFAAPMINIVVNPKTGAMTFGWRIPDDEPLPLSDFTRVGAVLSLVADARDGGLTIAYEKDGVPLDFARQDAPIPVPRALRELAVAAAHATFIARQFDLAQDVAVTAGDLHEELSRLTVMRGFLEGQPPSSFAVSVRIPESAGKDFEYETAGIVVPVSARVGDHVIALAICAGGKPEWDPVDAKLTVKDGAVEVLEKWVVPIESWEAFDVRQKAFDVAGTFEPKCSYGVIIRPGENAP